MAKRSRLTRWLYGIVVLIVAGAILIYLGPRTHVSTDIKFDPATIGEDVEDFIASQEARFSDIRPGQGKQIVWAYPASRAKTPLSLVYIHGFSASPGEIRPVMDIVAKDIGANLFYTRLVGHGRTSDAMAEATVEGWVNDLAEAIAIGRRLGERVILVGTSTGGTLTTWAATQPDLTADVAGIVNIAPNYGIQAAGAGLLTIPWAKQILGVIAGERRSFEPKNDLQRANWTHEYPSEAVLPMAELVRLVKDSDFETIDIPILFIFSENDTVVQPDATKVVAGRWGGESELVIINDSDDKDHHVIAGDAISPSTTQKTVDIIEQWIGKLPGES
ncbi:alpha/beta hydrolase [Hoeflea poritis]|uniref:Alpha/beta hydrolase n=1 Tax=Hoeflea poritis TaxID=2993659 RepID=A0ABT4VPS7_9HYPH|nr:alpha/beta hydrolase [Hoeflea poritis]MDA4846708.1 alpha/beta hydrolase [Hoeflea poritis]